MDQAGVHEGPRKPPGSHPPVGSPLDRPRAHCPPRTLRACSPAALGAVLQRPSTSLRCCPATGTSSISSGVSRHARSLSLGEVDLVHVSYRSAPPGELASHRQCDQTKSHGGFGLPGRVDIHLVLSQRGDAAATSSDRVGEQAQQLFGVGRVGGGREASDRLTAAPEHEIEQNDPGHQYWLHSRGLRRWTGCGRLARCAGCSVDAGEQAPVLGEHQGALRGGRDRIRELTGAWRNRPSTSFASLLKSPVFNRKRSCTSRPTRQRYRTRGRGRPLHGVDTTRSLGNAARARIDLAHRNRNHPGGLAD